MQNQYALVAEIIAEIKLIYIVIAYTDFAETLMFNVKRCFIMYTETK